MISLRRWVLAAVCGALAVSAAQAAPQGQSFTYQGQLKLANAPFTGTRDLTFALYDAATGGVQIGTTQVANAYPIVDGLFTIDLAFPGAFSGQQRWLQVTVNGQPLTPRQPVTAAPVAQYALSGNPGATGATGAQGPIGATGAAGAQGLTGPEGPIGATGPQGAIGPTGIQGDIGPTGPAGVPGATGAQGDIGPTGAQGAIGPTGAQGPQGSSGALGVYGDGSAGTFIVPNGNTLDLTTTTGYTTLSAQGKASLQFTDITVSGTLVVPSGTVLRATGNVVFNSSASVIVATGAADSGNGPANPGISLAPAGSIQGGIGLGLLQASQLRRPEPAAGGAGDRNITAANMTGGEGGGSLLIAARGNVTIQAGGVINANGNTGVNPGGSTDIGGPGGGAGGLVIVAAQGSISVAGTIRAIGGNGGPGVNGNGGVSGAGGGGGGGGGIVRLIAAGTISSTGSVSVGGGSAGSDAFSGSFNQPGSGGGACGGNGGNGGNGAATFATPGTAGHAITVVVPSPENLLVP